MNFKFIFICSKRGCVSDCVFPYPLLDCDWLLFDQDSKGKAIPILSVSDSDSKGQEGKGIIVSVSPGLTLIGGKENLV